MISNIISAFTFTLVIVCIQSSPPDAQLFRPVLLNQNGQPYITNKIANKNYNKNEIEPKIIGGTAATMQNTKYQVSIRLRVAEGVFGNGHICGGSLITYKSVLTAAHCLFYFDEENKEGVLRSTKEFVVVMGTMNRFIKTSTTLSYTITQFLYHHKFDAKTMSNDIAMMFLNGEVPANYPTVQPINLPTFPVQTGTICQINGWGTTTFQGSPTNILLTANVTLFNNKQCLSYGSSLQRGMMCAGDYSGKPDACQGDSGGPLACENTLAGIVSWGNKCGTPGWPGIYTNVSYYRNWIVVTDRRNGSNSLYGNFVLCIALLISLEFSRRKSLKL